eukprot:14593501-Alexandrium_andersonii.AAC.1
MHSSEARAAAEQRSLRVFYALPTLLHACCTGVRHFSACHGSLVALASNVHMPTRILHDAPRTG